MQTCAQAREDDITSLFPLFTWPFLEHRGALGMLPAAQAQQKEMALPQRGTVDRYWQGTRQKVWQYYFLVAKVQAHRWPNFCQSFIFLKPQVNFQTEGGLELALGVHKTIPPECGRLHARNTDLCHSPWITKQKCLYQSVIKHNILVGLSCASWFAFRGKRHRKRTIKNSTQPSIPKMYIKFMCTRSRKPSSKIYSADISGPPQDKCKEQRVNHVCSFSAAYSEHKPTGPHPIPPPCLSCPATLLFLNSAVEILLYISWWPTTSHKKEYWL